MHALKDTPPVPLPESPRIVVAPDAFKGTLDGPAAAGAIARGFRRAWPAATLVELPLGDGGEGTAAVLATALGGVPLSLPVTAPLGGRSLTATGFQVSRQRLLLLDMAAASGLPRVPRTRRNPLETHTRGTGEWIATALRASPADALWIGAGGSATVDAGTGAARALGWRFLDRQGRELPLGGGALVHLHTVEAPAVDPLASVRVEVLCDVRHPLLGPRGAAPVFAPQKGADGAAVAQLEAALERFAQVVERDLGVAVGALPRGGAAGGLAAGFAALFGARLVPGVERVLEVTGAAGKIEGADLVITGEGRYDATSREGKVVGGVLATARRLHRPLALVVGSASTAAPRDVLQMTTLVDLAGSLEAAEERAAHWLEVAGERLAQGLQTSAQKRNGPG
jgi:glycerate kinase